MPAIRTDELMARIASYEEGPFPQKDHFHAALAPWKDRLDENALFVLTAALRKSDRRRARLVAEALGWLAGPPCGPLLVPVMLDPGAPLHQRAAAAAAIQEYAPGITHTLSSDERGVLLELPVREMVSEAGDDSFAAEAIRAAYRATPAQDRSGFSQALVHLAGSDASRVTVVLGHLLAVEEDPERRRELIALLGANPSQEAADFLAGLAATTKDVSEASVTTRLLEALHTQGFAGKVKPVWREVTCFATGSDGDSCFALTFVIPRPPAFTLVHFLISLVDGVRDAMVHAPASGREAEEFVAREREMMTPLSGDVPIEVGLSILQEALERSRPARPNEEPDVQFALRAMQPMLAGARALPDPLPARRHVSANALRGLLTSPGFEYWYLEPGEEVMRPALAVISRPSRAKTSRGLESEMTRRLDKVMPVLLERMVATGEIERVGRMLRHQARVLRAAGEDKRAKLCLQVAANMAAGDPEFLVHLAMRSLAVAAEATAAEPRHTRGREQEGRDSLLHRIEEGATRITLREVAELDLSAEIYQAVNEANRAAPSARRSSLASIEQAALAFARHFLKWLEGRAADPEPSEPEVVELVTGLRNLLVEKGVVDPAYRLDAAGEAAAAALNFVEHHCRGDCPHRCLDLGDHDGQLLFFSRPPLWEVRPEDLRTHANLDRSKRPQA
ncbi:MAG: hypothetical protein WBP56_17830 [Polyangia bacterium]|jgi:hypothetical protein